MGLDRPPRDAGVASAGFVMAVSRSPGLPRALEGGDTRVMKAKVNFFPRR